MTDSTPATAAGEVRDGYDAWKALDAQERATAAVPVCGITTRHNHSSFDDPIDCAWRDRQPASACEWCGRAIERDAEGRWYAVKGEERGYDPLTCDASDDHRHAPDQPEAAATERVAIVAWLRTRAREGAELLAELGDVVSPTTLALSAKAATYSTAADLIEEGAHHAD